MLVEAPHHLGRIQRRAATDGDNPVRLELLHGLGASQYGRHRGVGLYAIKGGGLHSGLLQQGGRLVEKTQPFHGAAAGHQHGALAFELA